MADEVEADLKDEAEDESGGSDGEMSVREAGKKGGDTVRKRYGSEFYKKIGRKGGKATREKHGAQFYEAIGQKGGRVVKDKYGAGFYEEIGHKGGQKVKLLIAEAKRSLAGARVPGLEEAVKLPTVTVDLPASAIEPA
jgi:uncharacterized protein